MKDTNTSHYNTRHYETLQHQQRFKTHHHHQYTSSNITHQQTHHQTTQNTQTNLHNTIYHHAAPLQNTTPIHHHHHNQQPLLNTPNGLSEQRHFVDQTRVSQSALINLSLPLPRPAEPPRPAKTVRNALWKTEYIFSLDSAVIFVSRVPPPRVGVCR